MSLQKGPVFGAICDAAVGAILYEKSQGLKRERPRTWRGRSDVPVR